MTEQLLPLELTPEIEITNRIHRLKKQMEQTGMDGVFLTHKTPILPPPRYGGAPWCVYVCVPLRQSQESTSENLIYWDGMILK